MWYKKSIILSIAFLFQFVLAGFSFAQNTTNVTQAGDNNLAAIDQTGDDNCCRVGKGNFTPSLSQNRM